MTFPRKPQCPDDFQGEELYAEGSGYLSVFPSKSRARYYPSAWSRYEASKGTGIKNLVEETEPPYKNALAAMRDGWQVIQMSEMKHRTAADGYELGPLPYQTVLSRFCELQDKEEGS